MQDRPTEIELLQAVAQFLSDEVAPVMTNPRLRFRALIAANVLNIVQRELVLRDASLLDEWQRLVSLLNRPSSSPPNSGPDLQAAVQVLNRELCARIRAGEADGRWHSPVFDHIWSTVVEKVQVTNPRYLQEN